MDPIYFPEANKTLKAPPGMENCVDLHVRNDPETVTSCWGMTWRDRLRALFTGRIWVSVWTPGGTHHPLSVYTENPFPAPPKAKP